MKILVTGSNGFIGKNFLIRLAEEGDFVVDRFTRADDVVELPGKVQKADAVVHLAGENRPADPEAYMEVNGHLTASICEAIRLAGRPIPLIFTSSIQAELNHIYGQSKRAGEDAVATLSEMPGQSCSIFRLPNVFGKWCRPDYNSVVATFCYKIARGEPIRIDDPAAAVSLVYIDDVVNHLIDAVRNPKPGLKWGLVQPVYQTTVGEIADHIRGFQESRDSLVIGQVGIGLVRALHSTYLSYLRNENFSYLVPVHSDARGKFVEMLKTTDSGQFSFFTAFPGVTRGGHYHHSKTEKFLVVKGSAKFGFRHILTGEYHSLEANGDLPQIVETIPGWSHDITNIGEDELVVLLWANEIFDPNRADTIARSV